jgi:hypothetical protein
MLGFIVRSAVATAAIEGGRRVYRHFSGKLQSSLVIQIEEGKATCKSGTVTSRVLMSVEEALRDTPKASIKRRTDGTFAFSRSLYQRNGGKGSGTLSSTANTKANKAEHPTTLMV